jgi:hypothetical protein
MTRRQFGVLYRDFLFRVVDRELLSRHARGDASQLLLQIVTLLVFVSIALSIPALVVDFGRTVPERVTAAWSLEHFLIATTMLAVGVLAVLSWGSMFPDHRDVLVLAPLPIRAHTILAARLAAVVTTLAVAVGSLHAVSGFVWPMVLNSRLGDVAIPATGSLGGWLRWSGAYWLTMIAAALFVFGLAMCVQGIAAAVLPRRLFLRVSSLLQLSALVLVVGVYFLEPMGVRPAAILAAQQGLGLSGSPSYWFLGLFQALNGSATLALPARNAWISLGITIAGTIIVYGLSYVHTLRRIAEQPDISPGATRLRRLPPFGSRIETAIVHFSVKTLLRSAPHRVILAFYWGVGLAFAAIAVKLPAANRIEPEALGRAWQASVPLLISSIVMMGFAVLAARLAFAMPRDLRANWIFRTLPSGRGQSYATGTRRALLAVSVTPIVVGAAVVFFSIWPWRPALGHVIALALLGCVLVEFALTGAPEIPCTRSYLPGKSQVHIAAYIGLVMLLPLALAAARVERDALQDRWAYARIVVVLAVCWTGARWRNRWSFAAAPAQLTFEDEPADQLLILDVWDSRFATHSERASTPGRSR